MVSALSLIDPMATDALSRRFNRLDGWMLDGRCGWSGHTDGFAELVADAVVAV